MVNKKIVQRISRYRDAVQRYRNYGTDKILSCELADMLGLTAAQIRKDFSMVGISGKKKAGYSIDSLMKDFNRILGSQYMLSAVIAGANGLGQAVWSELFLQVPHVQIAAGFDEVKNETLLKSGKNVLSLFPISILSEYIHRNQIPYGIIAVTDPVKAQSYLDQMVLAGIRGVLCFSFVELKAPSGCVVRYINVVHDFENMVFFAGKNADSLIPAEAI